MLGPNSRRGNGNIFMKLDAHQNPERKRAPGGARVVGQIIFSRRYDLANYPGSAGCPLPLRVLVER